MANLVNQRPIGRIPTDPDDGAYLSPNDMLLGRASSEVPQGPFKETKNPRERVEFVQKIVNSFWKRWYTIQYNTIQFILSRLRGVWLPIHPSTGLMYKTLDFKNTIKLL